MDITIDGFWNRSSPILAHAAGIVPQLKNFGFTYDFNYYKNNCKFVEHYGKMYPGKPLHLKNLW